VSQGHKRTRAQSYRGKEKQRRQLERRHGEMPSAPATIRSAFDDLQHQCHACHQFAADDVLRTEADPDPTVGRVWFYHREACPPVAG
jgi:hypothetical protein